MADQRKSTSTPRRHVSDVALVYATITTRVVAHRSTVNRSLGWLQLRMACAQIQPTMSDWNRVTMHGITMNGAALEACGPW